MHIVLANRVSLFHHFGHVLTMLAGAVSRQFSSSPSSKNHFLASFHHVSTHFVKLSFSSSSSFLGSPIPNSTLSSWGLNFNTHFQLFLLAKLDIDSLFLLAKHFSSRPLNSHSLSSNMALHAIELDIAVSDHLSSASRLRPAPGPRQPHTGLDSLQSSLIGPSTWHTLSKLIIIDIWHRHRHHSNSLITIHVCLAGSNVSTTTSRNLWLYFPLADLNRHEQFQSSRYFSALLNDHDVIFFALLRHRSSSDFQLFFVSLHFN